MQRRQKKTKNPLGDISFKIYRELLKTNQDKNLIYSPLSIALALSLLERGSGGQTRVDVNRFLGLDESNSAKAYESLQSQLAALSPNQDSKVKLQKTNPAFFDPRFQVISQFQDSIKKCFASEIKTVQFRTASEPARQTINSWVKKKTQEKIPELFKQGSITSDTALVLANAVYLKAPWSDQNFLNESLPFYKNGKLDQKQESVQYFTNTRRVGYLDAENAQVVELPYEGSKLAMYVVLPKQKDGLAQLEQSLSVQTLTNLLTAKPTSEYKRVALKLPKFGARTSASMNEILKKLGLEKLFEKVDLSRMITSRESLYVSAVVHEAFIKVDETGTEAAAATGLAVSGRSGDVDRQEPIPFVADHPFLYAIVHKETGVILFMGKTVSIETVQ